MYRNQEMYLGNKKEKIVLPSASIITRFPSISAIAALDATLAIAKTAILCDNPSIQELMNMIDDDEYISSHLFSAHNIVDTIDRLRLNIHDYNMQTKEHIKQIRNNDLPF